MQNQNKCSRIMGFRRQDIPVKINMAVAQRKKTKREII